MYFHKTMLKYMKFILYELYELCKYMKNLLSMKIIIQELFITSTKTWLENIWKSMFQKTK